MVSSQFRPYLPIMDRGDLFQDASLGLVRAHRGYDPESGPFLPYAIQRAKGEILDSIRRARFGHRKKGLKQPVSLDAINEIQIRKGFAPLQNSSPSEAPDIETKLDLAKILDRIPKRDKDLLIRRYGLFGVKPVLGRILGKENGVSESRIAQRCAAAIRAARRASREEFIS